ncbi:regucalcin-like [Homarus americanus]|uniref:Regucalcin n=1 Tax=Homarus americanus TaxID=6706 RepID=A0A8J5MMV6_HOMAM|nr:regucalcin-like [Homarus americanus]KAG7157358.1 Regucalcin-like 2 [Homarus americanus]
MSETVVVETVTKPAFLGEGPHWSVREQALYYVDIFNQNLHRYHPASQTHSTLHIEGGPVTLVVPHNISLNTFVVSVGRDLAAVTWPDTTKDCVVSSYNVLASVDRHHSKNRFNDGKCDANGRLWAGTMGDTDVPDNPNPSLGSLFLLADNNTAPTVLDKVSISNGLAWSEDNRTFYYVDTCEYRVEAFECDFEKVKISKRRTVYDYRQEGLYPSFPDGMTIDTKGNLWVASFGTGKIHCVNPTSGKLERWVEVPASNVTSVCWGGPSLDQLYVTSTQKGLTKDQLAKQPHAGAVFRVTGLGAKGHPPMDSNVKLTTTRS